MRMEQLRQWLGQISFRNLWNKYSSVCIVVIFVLLFTPFGNILQIGDDMKRIILNNTGLMLVVIGLSFIMIGGGIDFSIGYQISMISAVVSVLSIEQWPDWVVVLGALLVGLLCGAVNGALVAYLEIVPFAATIATQVICRGISYMMTNGNMVSYIAQPVRIVAKENFLGIRMDIWLVMLGFLIFWTILHYSFAGKYLRAVGLNEETALRAGIKVKRVKFLSYCIASVFYALAAMVLISRRGYAGSEIGIGMEITATVAAYIGGILVFAETQRIIMLFVGTLIAAIIESGVSRVGVNSALQYIVMGIILIISMTMHKQRRK